MKKIAGVLSALLCVLLFSSFSPSLDGRAVVADAGVMPQGIFAKTVGYLPGDSISVTNLLTKSTVDILVIGALDPSEGVAILLSPEAAGLLGLAKGGNNVVKITKRSGQLDEQVSGTAVIGGGTYENPDGTGGTEEEFVNEDKEVEIEETSGETLSEENIPEENITEETESPDIYDGLVSEPDEAVSGTDESVSESDEAVSGTDETVSESYETVSGADGENDSEPSGFTDPAESVSEDISGPEAESVSADDFSDNPDGSEEDVPEEDISERVEDDFVPEPYDEKDEDDSPVYEVISEDELPDVASSEPFEEEASDEDNLSEINEPEVSELPENLESESEQEKDVADEKNGRFFEEPELEELEEEELDEIDEFTAPEPAETSEETPGISEEAEETHESEEPEDESYEPIILVPSDMNPPERLSSSSETPVSVPGGKPSPEKDSADGWEDKILENESYLEKGKWYIQIAVLADSSNISSLVKRYEDDYPLVLVLSSNGKGYRVLVGPLSVDEYGTVLNRFRSYGFKDAFLRKIK